MIRSLVAVCLFVSVLAQEQDNDSCPNVRLQRNFNLTGMTGRWYVAKMFSTIKRDVGACGTYEFMIGEAGYATGKHSEVIERRMVMVTTSFYIRTPDNTKPAKLRTNFFGGNNEYDVQVLKIDYESYAILHMCTVSSHEVSQYTWVLTRKYEPSILDINVPLMVLGRTKIDRAYSTNTDLSLCPFERLTFQ